MSWESRLLGLVAAALVVFGVAAVYSASSIIAVRGGHSDSFFAVRQLLGGLIGLAVLIVTSRADYQLWRRFAWLGVGGATVLLVIPLLPIGSPVVPTINGVRRWVNFGLFTVQPSEVAKFALIAWAAMLAAKKGDKVRDFKWGLLPFLVVMIPMGLLIAAEPDLSTAALTLLLGSIVLFSSGARIGHFILLGILAVPLVWREIATVQFRLHRMVSFLSPGSDPLDVSWQISQSITGLGSGGLFGAGFGEGTQKLGYLPYAYSDFIFSTIGEEWGFVGVSVLLMLYAMFTVLGFRIARAAPDPFGKLLCVGLTALITVTALLHMAVAVALVPTTGLPLPFVSYGRSNLLMALLATGVMMSVSDRSMVRRR